MRPQQFDLRRLAAIYVGGVLGALARVGLAQASAHGPAAWPWGTFTVNMVGALLLGYFFARLRDHPENSLAHPFPQHRSVRHADLVENMRPMFDFLHRSGNLVLHHTGSTVLRTFDEEAESWQEGPSEDWVSEARGALYMAFRNLIFLMCDRFNISLLDSYVAVNPEGLGAFVKDGPAISGKDPT
jgi:hypothetical protein